MKKYDDVHINIVLEMINRRMKIIKKEIKFLNNIILKEAKIYYIYMILGLLLGIADPFIEIYGTKWLVDEIASVNRSNKEIVRIVLFIILSEFFVELLSKIISNAKGICVDKINRRIRLMINDTSMYLKYEDTENPVILDKQKAAVDGYFKVGVSGIFEYVSNVISSAILIPTMTYIVFRYSFFVLLLVIIDVIVSVIINGKNIKLNYSFFEKSIPTQRAYDYFTHKIVSQQYGKVIRLYGAGEFFLNKNDNFAKKIIALSQNNTKSIWKYNKLESLISYCILGGQYAIATYYIVKKKISIGTFSSLLITITSLNSSIKGIFNSIQSLNYNFNILNNTIEYLDEVRIDKKESIERKVSQYDIEFRHVWFKYPNTQEYILRDVNVKILPGECVAIVGKNGAGKTTFIKLLCKFYEVNKGEILINGKNINEYENSEYVQLLAVVFQDFKIFAFSAYENICFSSDCTKINNVYEACIKSGINEKFDKLDTGLNTKLYKMFDENGIELSGGEAQKVAIARALYKNAPIVILDEPTAALDPISEAELFEKINEMADGKTAIYISHRLSSCKFCDKIIVFDQGKIVDQGTHKELMRNKYGIYYDMYKIQSEYYQ